MELHVAGTECSHRCARVWVLLPLSWSRDFFFFFFSHKVKGHIAPSGRHSLACVDGGGQVWLAAASLHTSADFSFIYLFAFFGSPLTDANERKLVAYARCCPLAPPSRARNESPPAGRPRKQFARLWKNKSGRLLVLLHVFQWSLQENKKKCLTGPPWLGCLNVCLCESANRGPQQMSFTALHLTPRAARHTASAILKAHKCFIDYARSQDLKR